MTDRVTHDRTGLYSTLGILGRLSVVGQDVPAVIVNHCPPVPFFPERYSCYPQTYSTSTMSQVLSTAMPSTGFEAIFRAALEAYKEQTKCDITSHPLAVQLQSCDSPGAILTVLRAQVQEFDQSRCGDDRLTKWLDPTVNVLCAFSAALGNGIGLVSCERS
jgi:hypothetical protein